MVIPLSVREVLDFVARHQARGSVKAIARVIGANDANLHGILAGRRTLSYETMCNVAAAVGMRLRDANKPERLELISNTVLHIEVNQTDLPYCERVLASLTELQGDYRYYSGIDVTRAAGTSRDARRGPGVYHIIVARVGQGYVLMHVHYDAIEPVVWDPIAVEDDEDGGHFEEHEAVRGGEELHVRARYCHPSDTALWIRLRSCFISIAELEHMYGIRHELKPTLADWGRFLINIEQMRVTPEGVIRAINASRNR